MENFVQFLSETPCSVLYCTLHPFMVGKWVPTTAGKF